jgi:hypothetical protein
VRAPLLSPGDLLAMTVTSEVAAAIELALARQTPATARRKQSLAWKLMGVCLIAGLSAFNVW